jgi:uncharacterized protein (DUF1015 family)
MPEIKPFRAWRYHAAKVRDLERVVAPPYDVISKQEQAKLYEASPYNVIRMELGKDLPGDSEKQNRYTRAKQFLDDWKSEGVLEQEDRPAFYVYVQNYEEEGKKKTRTGFFAAMKLDEKAVLKHENTLTGPKEDRLHLLKAVRTNLSPIFGLIEDSSGAIQKALKRSSRTAPVLDVKVAGVRHRLFVERRSEALKKIVSRMRSKPMFIADGHHRFEVACQFKKWMGSSATERGGREADWNYVLTYFADCRHNPFKIFPTHRLVRLPKGMDLASTLRSLGAVRSAKSLETVLDALAQCREEARDKSYQFGFYTAKDGFSILTLDKRAAAKVAKNPVAKLDVAVLHEKILAPRFKIQIGAVPARGGSASGGERSEAIDFTRDPEEAVSKVQSGQFDAAVFLRPTSLNEMLLVSKKGLKMPQKSTYFYPKLLTGLVFYGFNGALS